MITLPQTKIAMEAFAVVHGPPPPACEGTCMLYRLPECRLCDLRPLKALHGITEDEALAARLITRTQLERMRTRQ